jgi:hypothetical protein
MNQLRSILLVFFAVSLLWKDVAAFTWNVHFCTNQKALAEEFCINRNKPQILCNGKCYLADQLQKIMQEEQQQKEKPIIPPLKLKDSEYYSTLLIIRIPEHKIIPIHSSLNVTYLPMSSYDLITKQLRPPSFFVR